MTRAAIYVRVSTDEQVRNLSLDTQRAACERYAQTNGWEIAGVFVEEGESAKTAARTQFERLVAFCRTQRGRVQYVVVYSISRFMRNTQEHLLLRGVLAGMGIQLRSVTEPLEETSSGRLVETVLAAFAQFDNDAKAERTIAGMRAALERGRWTHVAPLGYRNARDEEGRATLELDEQRAPLILRAFELAASGASQSEILRVMRSLGLTARKGARISAQTLGNVLRNPIYAGRVRSKAFRVEAEGNWPAIVDGPTWHAAQNAIGQKHPTDLHQRQHPDFPLRHFVRCAADGRPLTGYFAKGRTTRVPYYECPTCRARQGRDAFEDSFVALLDELRPDPRLLEDLRAEVLEKVREQRRHAEADADRLRRRSAEIEEAKVRLTMRFAVEGVISRGAHDAAVTKLDADRGEVEAALLAAQVTRLDTIGLIDYAARVITHMGTLWRNSTADQRVALQGFMLPGGVAWSKEAGFVRTQLSYFRFSDLSRESEADSRVASHRAASSNLWGRLARLREILPIAA